ncbi:long-chain-acyl-CoA synthetase [Terrihabitans soli]|uniref:Long-chain-acyl-CoA synthetase n=1 Tax=Terrihabitans soli TaxID=708113 RepID=A0A6S6QP64_9HYPH|nr:long-chain-acyl-CoA synthetase [Terrihabitans soli]BCJ89707.1 long-chain-acyl-CoA synthetase [Terrihabitans soli]
MFKRLKNDLALLSGALRTLRMMKPIMLNKSRTFPDVISELAEKYGDRPALISDKESFSYRGLDERANRYARWAMANGVGKGDVVALLMLNRAEYMAFWLGVTRAGGVVALLNTNLTGQSLGFCVDIVAPKHVVVGSELLGNFDTARSLLKTAPKIWAHGAGGSDARINEAVETFSPTALSPGEKPSITIEDRALFIYTSGTTGMPKAANINHYRLMAMTHGFCGVMNIKPDDRMYDVLPMYHSNGGVLATGAVLMGGGRTYIREKFSAREFWDDAVRVEATLVFYIGELCRYLLHAPQSPSEQKHKIRLFCGNGLRADVWPAFQARFAIPKILEWYAATEGNVAVFNWDGTPGAVGRIPSWMEKRFVVKIVRFDIEKEEPVRGPDGLVIEAEPGETGEAIGRIVADPNKPANRFEGYADKSATEKKILRDVVEKGDMWFRTGDLLRKDKDGYFYFVDRIGDTFRWKGENVSTIEVAQALTDYPGVEDAIAYGVEVPGQDGRAGMVTLVTTKEFDLKGFEEHVAQRLPDYARPVFLRQSSEIDVTGTFKQRRLELQKEGFDPAKVTDALYFRDAASGAFQSLDAGLRTRICEGQIRP